jgi:hypothetical protein
MAVTMGYGLLKWSSFFVFCPLSHFLKMTASKSLASLKKKESDDVRSATKQDYVGELTKFSFCHSAVESVLIHILPCREFHGDLFDEIYCLPAAVFIARYLMNYYASICIMNSYQSYHSSIHVHTL